MTRIRVFALASLVVTMGCGETGTVVADLAGSSDGSGVVAWPPGVRPYDCVGDQPPSVCTCPIHGVYEVTGRLTDKLETESGHCSSDNLWFHEVVFDDEGRMTPVNLARVCSTTWSQDCSVDVLCVRVPVPPSAGEQFTIRRTGPASFRGTLSYAFNSLGSGCSEQWDIEGHFPRLEDQ